MYKNILLIIIILVSFSCNEEQQDPQKIEGIVSEHAMVVTAHPIATSIGLNVLKKGGNAFDAAIAIQFALSVVYPRAGNIAGGGFMTYRTKDGQTGCWDFREVAPSAATKDMFLDENGEIIKNHRSSGLAVGVPGSIDGMIEIHKKFGSLPFEDLVYPSIVFADRGITLTEREAEILNKYSEELKNINPRPNPFVKEGKWKENDVFSNPELVTTLWEISKKGRNGFYSGPVADSIIKRVNETNGIISYNDLANYKSKHKDAHIFNYKDYKIITPGLPSSGGIVLNQLFKGAEDKDLQDLGHNSADYIHFITELERRAYQDRAAFLADPDFVEVNTDSILSTQYLEKKFSDISMSYKTNSVYDSNYTEVMESHETTHFTIVDEYGNAVSVTTTLNSNFGSKIYVYGGGFFLNNEMDDFSIKTGVPNQFGLTGNEANAIEPGKRMLSSMTPTIVEKDHELFMLTGTPGGSTIMTSIFQTILNVIEFDMTMQEAVNAKRFHSQWLPDILYIEEGAANQVIIDQIKSKGHTIEYWNMIGKVEAILRKKDGTLVGAADYHRGDDTALGY